MPFELAIRLIEIGVGLALIQRGVEHLGRETAVFVPQVFLALLLQFGVSPDVIVPTLWLLCIWQLHRFQGPVNGGSDKMAMLILLCLSLVHLAPSQDWADLALSYLAVQVILSYFVSGWVKLRNSDWRSGAALRDVFAFSAYPSSEGLRSLADRSGLMLGASWAVILFECLFPLSLLHPTALAAALALAAAFHLANAICFGLNRFLWIWISSYPAVLWFQSRLFGGNAAGLF